MCIIDEQNIDTVNVAFIKLYLVNKEGLSTTDQKRYSTYKCKTCWLWISYDYDNQLRISHIIILGEIVFT